MSDEEFLNVEALRYAVGQLERVLEGLPAIRTWYGHCESALTLENPGRETTHLARRYMSLCRQVGFVTPPSAPSANVA